MTHNSLPFLWFYRSDEGFIFHVKRQPSHETFILQYRILQEGVGEKKGERKKGRTFLSIQTGFGKRSSVLVLPVSKFPLIDVHRPSFRGANEVLSALVEVLIQSFNVVARGRLFYEQKRYVTKDRCQVPQLWWAKRIMPVKYPSACALFAGLY